MTELDDQFFTSDPYSYIRARILTLLSADRPALGGSAADEFVRLLGPSSAHFAECDERTAKLQRAVDAFALRHQTAESLIRLLHVVLHHQTGHSYWVELADAPIKNVEVIKQNRSALDADEDGGLERMRTVLLPTVPELADGSEVGVERACKPVPEPSYERASSSDLEAALDVHISWINFAIQLFLQDSPDLDAAHNKFKHGMGLRPQDDLLSTLTTAPPQLGWQRAIGLAHRKPGRQHLRRNHDPVPLTCLPEARPRDDTSSDAACSDVGRSCCACTHIGSALPQRGAQALLGPRANHGTHDSGSSRSSRRRTTPRDAEAPSTLRNALSVDDAAARQSWPGSHAVLDRRTCEHPAVRQAIPGRRCG